MKSEKGIWTKWTRVKRTFAN